MPAVIIHPQRQAIRRTASQLHGVCARCSILLPRNASRHRWRRASGTFLRGGDLIMSKVAIVHDYFVQTGGAERVAEALYSIYPDATVFATVALPDHMPPQLEAAEIRTTWMQRLPRMSQYYRHYFLLYPWAVESLDLNGYDLILSSSSGYAKELNRPDGSVPF